jgi:hypothetical protein
LRTVSRSSSDRCRARRCDGETGKGSDTSRWPRRPARRTRRGRDGTGPAATP